MDAALGDVSAGGSGAPEFDMTHSGGGPCAFVASQSGGKAGGVTLSKFSLNPTSMEQGGGHESVAGSVTSALEEISTWPQPSPSGEADPRARSAMARDEQIAPNMAMQNATKKSEQRILRNRGRVNIRSGFAIIESNVLAKSAETCQHFPW
jgi:hypothetical protein